MSIVFILNLFLILLGYCQMAYGLIDRKCNDGSNMTHGTRKEKPTVEIQLQKKDVYVDDHVYFTCKVDANPGAEIFWFYEGEYINNKNQQAAYNYGKCNTTLTIKYAEPKDTGRYHCVAKNSYGVTSSATVLLTVMQRAKYERNYESASIEMHSSSSCDPVQHNVTLMCKHNDSTGICVWKRYNQSMNEEKMSYCDDRMCCVNFNGFSKEDSGVYMCYMYYDVRRAKIDVPEVDGKCSRFNKPGILETDEPNKGRDDSQIPSATITAATTSNGSIYKYSLDLINILIVAAMLYSVLDL